LHTQKASHDQATSTHNQQQRSAAAAAALRLRCAALQRLIFAHGRAHGAAHEPAPGQQQAGSASYISPKLVKKEPKLLKGSRGIKFLHARHRERLVRMLAASKASPGGMRRPHSRWLSAREERGVAEAKKTLWPENQLQRRRHRQAAAAAAATEEAAPTPGEGAEASRPKRRKRVIVYSDEEGDGDAEETAT
jgi:hypothetical protein